MVRRKTDPSEDFATFAFLIVLMGGLILWAKTRSAPIAIIWMIAILLSLAGFGVAYGKYRQHQSLESGIDIVDTMSGEEFELFLKAHFDLLGYRTEMTATTGDYGADLVATRDDVKYVIQAKRWKRPVGIEAVQQVIGAIKHYGATNAIVVTNSTYTDAARALAQSNGVELWDREKLLSVIANVAGRERAGESVFPEQSPTETKACPKCGGSFVKRNGKRGEFLGCSSHPKCHYTQDL